MSRWKINGILIIKHQFDHKPEHVHVYEDGKRVLRFDTDNWKILSGELTPKVAQALEKLKQEGKI